MTDYNQGYLDAIIGIRTMLETKISLGLIFPEDISLASEIKALSEVIKFLEIRLEKNEES